MSVCKDNEMINHNMNREHTMDLESFRQQEPEQILLGEKEDLLYYIKGTNRDDMIELYVEMI